MKGSFSFFHSRFLRGRWSAPLITMTMVITAIGFSGEIRGEEPWWLSHPADPYPLIDCVVCDSILDEDAEFLDFDGREIRVCGNVQCGADFFGSADTWMAVVDERIVEQQQPLYPVTTCLVDGESLETAGAIEFVFFNRLFLVCSDGCCDAIKEDPEKYFGLLNKAVIEKQKPGYPLDECIVSGAPLDEKAIDYVVANQLVRLADEDQIEMFDEMAGKYLAKLRKLTKEKAD